MNPLWQQLVEAGLVIGDPPPPEPAGPAWYVHALLGCAAWVAALFLTIVLVAFFRFEGALAIGGTLACAAGLALLRSPSPFLTQLGLAASIAGQAGLLFGLGVFRDFNRTAAVMAAILILPSLLTTNSIYRAWCTGASILLLAAALEQWSPLTIAIAAALVTFVFLVQPQIPRAYGYGAAIALVAIDLLTHFGRNPHPQAPYAGGLLAGLALVYTAHHFFGLQGSVYAALISLILIPAPGVAAALLIILIGFGCAAPTLTGLGIAAGLAYLSHFYYSQSFTLLNKSLVLLATGLALLALRWFLFRKEKA